ncbi:hypothetical protein JCM3766R1_005097 [Sporobolomyces carnicolor]
MVSEGDANYRDATRGRDAWKQNSFNLNLLSSPPPSSHFACTRTTSYNSLESKHLQPESCLRPRVVPLPPPLAPPPQIALMPPTKEEVAARQMVWDDEFTSGRSICAGVFIFVPALMSFFQLCKYFTTTLGSTENLRTNRLYFFLSHQKATLKELMGAECKALELWTNSLVVVSLDSMNKSLLRNLEGIFDNVETDIGGYDILDDEQKKEWADAVKRAREREPLPFDKQMELSSHLNHNQRRALRELIDRQKDGKYDYESEKWPGRDATELERIRVGDHELTQKRLYAILKGSISNVQGKDERAELVTALKKIPNKEKEWCALAHGAEPIDDEEVQPQSAKVQSKNETDEEVDQLAQDDPIASEDSGLDGPSFPDSPRFGQSDSDVSMVSEPTLKLAKKKTLGKKRTIPGSPESSDLESNKRKPKAKPKQKKAKGKEKVKEKKAKVAVGGSRPKTQASTDASTSKKKTSKPSFYDLISD